MSPRQLYRWLAEPGGAPPERGHPVWLPINRQYEEPHEVESCHHVGVDVIAPVAELVRSCGLDVHKPVYLRSTNNVVVWLSPSPVVAKISKEHERAGREFAVLRELVELGAPVVPPADLGIEQPVIIDAKTITFWRYEPQDDAFEQDPGQIAESLFPSSNCTPRSLRCEIEQPFPLSGSR